jgi:hypothetical protein
VARDRSYVKGGPNGRIATKSTMAEELTNSEVAAPSRNAVLAAAAIVGVLLAGTVALWAHYGTAVFFETIRAGLIACFG